MYLNKSHLTTSQYFYLNISLFTERIITNVYVVNRLMYL